MKAEVYNPWELLLRDRLYSRIEERCLLRRDARQEKFH